MNFAKLIKRLSGNTFIVLSHGANKREHLRKTLQCLLEFMEVVGEYGSYSICFKSDDPNTICITRERKDLEQVVEALPLNSTCAAVPRNICNSDDIHDIEFVMDEFLWLAERKDATLYVTRKEFGAFQNTFDALILDSELYKHLEGQCVTTEMGTPQPMSFCEGLNTSVAAKAETTVENQQLQQGEVMSFVTFLSFCDLEQNDFGNILLSGIKRLDPQLYPVVKETYKVRVNESDTAAVKYLFQVLQAQSVDCTLAEGIEEDPNRHIVEQEIGRITDKEWNAMCAAWNAYTSDPQLYKGSVVPDMVQAWLKDFRK
mgnify:CR=1 FL=1